MNRTNADEPQARAQENGGTRRADKAERVRAPEAQDRVQRRQVQVDRLREVGRNLGEQLDEQVHKRPYAVVGAALGVGFAAGSVFGSRLGQVMLAAGLGYVAKHFLGGDFGMDKIQATLEKMTTEAERVSTSS